MQLRHLYLGIGTMPWAHPLQPEDDDYLSRLTDLTFLETLRLNNMHLYVDGPGVAVPFTPILPALFRRATSLQSITVERFGPDILSLVQLIQEAQTLTDSPMPLSALQILRYGESLHFKGDEPGPVENNEYSGDPIFSVPLSGEAGYSWRRLCYSGFPYNKEPQRAAYSVELLRVFVARCRELEELMVPIHNRAEMEILKNEVLPNLTRLRLLHLAWGDLAEGFLSRLACPSPNPYDFRRMSADEKVEALRMGREVDREMEKKRIVLVREIFECRLALERDHPGMDPLAHVAINEGVYGPLFLPNMASDGRSGKKEEEEEDDHDPYLLSDASRITPLPRQEARAMGIVDILHMNDIFWIV